jgi:hypothetical protein
MYRVTISNGTHDKVLEMPGILTDQEWLDKQKVCEDRFKKRKIKSTMHRAKGAWREVQ